MLNVTMHLIRVPDVDHAVRVCIGRGHLEFAKQTWSSDRAIFESLISHLLAANIFQSPVSQIFLLMICEPGGSNLSSFGFS